MFLYFSSGNSTLNIKTAPLQIVWNELCIRQLVLCFASKSTASDIDLFVQSAVERNKLLSQGIKKFKAELSAPSYKVTTITMEIYAPSILIPERYDEDCGCVRLDTGKLLIHGRKGFAGMSLKLQLLSVNIGIPTKIAQMTSKTAPNRNRSASDDGPEIFFAPETTDGSYLIKPFDVNVSLDKFTHNKTADTVLSVAVSPRIDAHLDSLNLIRLQYILKNMVQSLKKQKDPIASAAKKSAKKAEKELKKKKAEQKHEDGELEINYYRQLMYCHFSLPSAHIALSLSAEHTIDFTVHGIALKFISRIGDVRCVLGLESLSLNDSMRPKNHRAIIWTADGHHHSHHSGPSSNVPSAPVAGSTIVSKPKDTMKAPFAASDLRLLFGAMDEDMHESDEENAMKDPSDHPIVFSLTSVSTIQSPLFQGIQKDISVTWGGICSNMDNQAVQRFGPFALELTNNVKIYKDKAEEHDRQVAEFTQLMAFAANDHQSRSRKVRKASEGGLMSPGGTVVPASVNVRGRNGSFRPVSLSRAQAAGAVPPLPSPKKTPKIGHSRITFNARSMTLDILQELVLADAAPTTIDSSVAFAEFNDMDAGRDSILTGSDTGRDSFYEARRSRSMGSEDMERDLPDADVEGEDDADEDEEEDESLESAFRVEFGNIFFQMLSKEDEKEINAHMTTFSLKDVRHSSQKFVFNTLLSRSDKQQALQTAAASSAMRLQKRDDDAEHILRVKFIKQTKAFIEIEVVLQDITSYVSVDIFLACATLLNENVKALKAVKKIMKANKKKAEPSLKTKLAMEAYAKSKRKGSSAEAPPISEKKVVRNLSIIVLNPLLHCARDVHVPVRRPRARGGEGQRASISPGLPAVRLDEHPGAEYATPDHRAGRRGHPRGERDRERRLLAETLQVQHGQLRRARVAQRHRADDVHPGACEAHQGQEKEEQGEEEQEKEEAWQHGRGRRAPCQRGGGHVPQPDHV
jgi:hypothetical protein